MGGEERGVDDKVIVRVENGLVNRWRWLVEDQRRLMVHNGRSMYDDRWLVIDDGWTFDKQRGAMNDDLRAMIDLGRWVVDYRWTIHNNILLFLLRHLENLEKWLNELWDQI